MIKNKRVIEFYKKYKLDIEAMNILVIDLFEKMMTDISGNMNSIMSSDQKSILNYNKNI
jgi:hypothetical protein